MDDYSYKRASGHANRTLEISNMESDIPSSSTNLNDASLVLEPDIANEIECADSETSAPDSDNASLCSLDLVEPPDTSSNNILPDHQKPFDHVSRLLKGKEKEWAAVLEKKSPLNLLDLPIDILKEIIKEVRCPYNSWKLCLFNY